jgi:hypothetical protein
MPFTLSHAAAALPFQKLKPVWPALVIGTFAPDLQYFTWISDEDRSGHHFPGIVMLAIPLALLLLWLFECYVKGPAIELLPNSVQRRLQDKVDPLSFWGWGRVVSIVLWISVGIATHVLWDSFTHYSSWITQRWSIFHQTVPLPFHHQPMVYKLLQHGSTVLGLLVLAAWVAAWYRKSTPVPRASLHPMSSFRKVTTVFIMAVGAVLIGYPAAIFRLTFHSGVINPLFRIVTIFEAMTLVLGIQVLIYGLARTLSGRTRRMPAPQLDGHSRGL